MAQETTNNPRNDSVMTAKRFVGSYHQAQTLLTIICSIGCKQLHQLECKKTSQESKRITKRLLIVGDFIVKNIEPYKMKKVQNTLQR